MVSDELKKALRLKEDMEAKQRQKERAVGALEALTRELKELGANNLAEAEELLTRLGKKIAKGDKQLAAELAHLTDVWEERSGGSV